MKRSSFKRLTFAFVVFGLLSSCEKENPLPEEPPIPDPTGCEVVEVTPDGVGAVISTPTVWLSGKVYVVRHNVTITSVLTIEPGAIIKVDNARIETQSSGKIIANGTPESRIIFTSIADDSYCGDSNGDGSATTPQKGDWHYLYLNNSSGQCVFTYCNFYYAGSGSGQCIYIAVGGVSFNFDNCIFAHTQSSSSSAAYAFHGGSYMIDPTVSKFTNNILYDNDRPIFVNAYYTLSTSNSFHNPNNPLETNARNGIFTYLGSNPANATVSWNISEVPYIMDGYFSGGGSGATGTVNIGDNVVVKFASSSAGIAKANSRIVNIGNGAILTSIKDDEHGGDTNGDGTASTPQTGDWDGFWDYGTNSYVSGAYILYSAN